MLTRLQRADPASRLALKKATLSPCSDCSWATECCSSRRCEYGTGVVRKCNESHSHRSKADGNSGAEASAVDSQRVIPGSPADWASRTEQNTCSSDAEGAPTGHNNRAGASRRTATTTFATFLSLTISDFVSRLVRLMCTVTILSPSTSLGKTSGQGGESSCIQQCRKYRRSSANQTLAA